MNTNELIRQIALALHGKALANAQHQTADQLIAYDHDGEYDPMVHGGVYGGFKTAYDNLLLVLCDGDEAAYDVLSSRIDRKLHDVMLPVAREGDLDATIEVVTEVLEEHMD